MCLYYELNFSIYCWCLYCVVNNHIIIIYKFAVFPVSQEENTVALLWSILQTFVGKALQNIVIPDYGNNDEWDWMFCQARSSLVVNSSGFLTDVYDLLC
jgi:hypothetical protein